MNVDRLLEIFPDHRSLASREFRRHLAFTLRAKGSFLCRAGEPMPWLLFLLEGRARVFLPLFGGREFLFRIYHSGDLIGDVEFFLGAPATCSVQCTADTLLCTFPCEVIRSNPAELAEPIHSLGRGVAEKLRENSISEAVSSGYPAASRLAAYFLRLRDPAMGARNLQELSEWLGISYRHLTRTLRDLVSAGALVKEGRSYAVGDRRNLEEVANEVMQEQPPWLQGPALER